MSMDRWNPFREIESMRQAMDRWMDDRTPQQSQGQGNMLSVAMDIHETDNGYELEASLPGIRAEDIDINVDRETVTIRGQTNQADERREIKNYLYRERRSGSFYRTIRLPEAIDSERVEAHLDHGILKLHLPRLSQNQQRKVQVKSGQRSESLNTSGPKTTTTPTPPSGSTNVPISGSSKSKEHLPSNSTNEATGNDVSQTGDNKPNTDE